MQFEQRYQHPPPQKQYLPLEEGIVLSAPSPNYLKQFQPQDVVHSLFLSLWQVPRGICSTPKADIACFEGAGTVVQNAFYV